MLPVREDHVVGQQQGRTQQGLAKFRKQGGDNRMIGDAQANGFALRVQYAPWQLLRALKDEGVRPGSGGFQETVLAVVHPGVGSDLGEVSTQQREMVTLINAADATDAGQKRIVTGVPSKGVGRVSGRSHQTTVAHDLSRLFDKARLGLLRM